MVELIAHVVWFIRTFQEANGYRGETVHDGIRTTLCQAQARAKARAEVAVAGAG